MNLHLQGGKALVTGASSGIGHAIAMELAGRGCTPILVARRRDRLETLAEEIREEHDLAAEVRTLDLLDEVAVRELEQELETREDLDLLVNNAGLGMNGRFLDAEPERLQRVVTLDLETPLRLARAAARAMVRRGGGAILDVCSIASFVPTPHHAVYSATKAAYLLQSEAMGAELRDHGVAVTALCPGVTDTEFFEAGDYAMGSVVYKMKRMPARSVARAALRGLEKGRARVIPGLRNRMLLRMTKLLPQGFVIAAAGRTMSTDRAL